MQFAAFFSAESLTALTTSMLDACCKATLLLGLAACLARSLRSESAALRHLVWTATLAALVALPGLSWLLPGWRVLPSWLARGPSAADARDAGAAGAFHAMQGALPDAPSGLTPAAGLSADDRAARPSVLPDRVAAATAGEAGDPSPVAGIRSIENGSPADAAAGAASGTGWPFWFAWVWGTGVALLLARLVYSRWRLGALCRRGAPVCAGPLHDEHRRAGRAAGLWRQPRLYLSADPDTIPLAFGVLRAHVVLPHTAQNWAAPQQRTVLMHELGHVARLDPLWQVLAQLAAALYWPNPFVWLAAWRMGIERERACDDLVLSQGVAPGDYARHLLDVVSGGRARRTDLAMGIAMASSSQLEDRLCCILAPTRSRRPVTRAAFASGLLTAALLGAPLAMLRAQDGSKVPPADPAAEASARPAGPDEETDTPFGPVNPGLTPDHHTVALRYDETMLVVWNETGALGVVFTQPGDAPAEVRYEWRMVDAQGQESRGSGTLSTTATDPQPLGVGKLQLTATFLNSSQGHFDYNPDEVAVTPLARECFTGRPAPVAGLSATKPVELSRFLYPDPLAARLYREHEHQGPDSRPFDAGDDVASFVRYGGNGLVVSTIDGTAVFVFGGTIDRAQENEHYYGVTYRWRFVSTDGQVSSQGRGAVQEVFVDEQYASRRTTHYLEAGPIHLVWSQGGQDGGWVYHNPAWHAVWFVDHGRAQALIQQDAPASQVLRFAYGRHQPRDPRQTAGDEAPAESQLPDEAPPAAEPPVVEGEAAPTKPFRTEAFAHVIQEQDGWMRLVPTTEADREWIDAILSWGSNDYDGWRVGALLVNDLDTDQPLQAGDPAAVRYFLQNVSAEPRTIRVQPVDYIYPVLGEGGQLNVNLMHRGENIEFTALPGEAVSPGGFEIPLETAGMPDGQYEIYTVSAFSVPNEDGSGGGSYWRVGAVTLTIGQGGQFSMEAQTDEQGIVWGGSVVGLRVGMRMSNRLPQQALGAVLQGEMFVWNTTERAITLEWDPPAPLDQNQVVYDEQGAYVNLNRVFYTGIRPQNPQTFTLQPGEQTQVGSSVLQSAAEATQPGPSDPAQLVAATGKFTWQVYLSLSLQELPQFTVIAGSGPVPLEIVAE